MEPTDNYRIVGGPPIQVDGEYLGYGQEFTKAELGDDSLLDLYLDSGQVVRTTATAKNSMSDPDADVPPVIGVRVGIPDDASDVSGGKD